MIPSFYENEATGGNGLFLAMCGFRDIFKSIYRYLLTN